MRTFIEKFDKVTLKIRNPNPKVILDYMITTLRPTPFMDFLGMTSSTSMNELRQRATKFMRLKEMREYINKIIVDTMPVENKEVGSDAFQKGGLCLRESKLRFSCYIPLNAQGLASLRRHYRWTSC